MYIISVSTIFRRHCHRFPPRFQPDSGLQRWQPPILEPLVRAGHHPDLVAAPARGQPPHDDLRVRGLQRIQALPHSPRATGPPWRRPPLSPDPHPALLPPPAQSQTELPGQVIILYPVTQMILYPGQEAIQEAGEKGTRGQIYLWIY